MWALAGSFWTFLGFQTGSVRWFSIIMFVGGGFCALQILLSLVVLVRHSKDINRLDDFLDVLR